VPANWKIFIDALQEQYHSPIVHSSQRPDAFEDTPMQQGGFEALHYQIDGPHRMFSSPGIQPWLLPDDKIKPSERVLRSGLFGDWDETAVLAATDVASTRPGGHESVGVSLFEIWPNFGIQFWQRGWFHTYHHWPTSDHSHIFECNLYFSPARNARERLAHEMTAVTFKEFALQDDNLIASIQMTLGAGVIDVYPLGDQEILVRHLHQTAADWVRDYIG
jgi:glycine betaine catabolism A